MVLDPRIFKDGGGKRTGGFTVQDQLKNLSDEDLDVMEQEIRKKQIGKTASTVSGGLLRGAEGILAASQGRALPERKTSTGLEDLLEREQLKNVTDPTRRKSQLEIDEIERLRSQQAGAEDAEIVGETKGVTGSQAQAIEAGDETAPQMFISVPKGKDKFGIIQYDTIKNPEFEAVQKKKDVFGKKEAELKADVVKGRLVNTNNLNLLSGVVRDVSQVYADSFEEGGAGGILQSAKAGIATKIGDLPGGTEVGGKFAASGAFPGKRMELILKMMPMLTQQATKPEGSVRIITGVLDALGMTIPELGTAPRTADRQLSESLKTFYRFARTAEQLGLSVDEAFQGKPVDQVRDDEITAWAQQVASQAGGIVIKGDEEKALESMLEQSLAPIRDIRRGEGDETSEGVVMEDAQGNRALVDPKTKKVIREL